MKKRDFAGSPFYSVCLYLKLFAQRDVVSVNFHGSKEGLIIFCQNLIEITDNLHFCESAFMTDHHIENYIGVGWTGYSTQVMKAESAGSMAPGLDRPPSPDPCVQ